MTMARARLVDPTLTRWYHCITRCVRKARLLDEGAIDRKNWLENRLRELSGVFSIAVAGFAVMDNHLHVLVRLDPHEAGAWSDEEVVRRWGRLFPPRDKKRQTLPLTKDWIDQRVGDSRWIALARERLSSLSWFMKCLKEPLSRMANREDDVRGAFFEGRFKSVAILDEEALLATCAYIDLNPVAAGLAALPESSAHTSIKARVDHLRDSGQTHAVEAATGVIAQASPLAQDPEAGLWLCPVEDRRGKSSGREGMLDGLTIGHYLQIVDYTSRLLREGKAAVGSEVAGIFDRLRISSAAWQSRLKKLGDGRLFGRFFAGSREALRAAAGRLGVHHLANLQGCQTV